MDYSLPKTTFPMGLSENGTQCIGVIIHDDDIVEDDEKIVLTLVSLNNIKLVSIPEQYRTATVYIIEHPRDCEFVRCVCSTGNISMLSFSSHKCSLGEHSLHCNGRSCH